MITAILVVVAVVCAIGWLCYWISTAALLAWIQEKGYTLPNDKELKECTKFVVSRLFNFK